MAAEPLLASRSRVGGKPPNAGAFETIYRSNYRALHTYAERRLPERADDVVAETLLVAWRRLGDVPEDSLPWLYGVARRVIADFRRSARRQAAVAVRIGGVRRDEASVVGLADSELALALATLSEGDRELLLLIHWEDLELARVARALGCSRAAAATRLWRARRRLRTALARTGGDEQ